ncbi:MAG: transglycosylase family protein [Solirubrobacteraceae bacterium]
MNRRRRMPTRPLACAALLACAMLVLLPAGQPARASSLNQLSTQLHSQQARQGSLSASLDRLGQLVAALDSQITLVRSREAAVRDQLTQDRLVLARTRVALARERRKIRILKARLAWSRSLLSRQLVSEYEGSQPDLVTVALEARGFSDLVGRLDYLRSAQHQQQAIITLTRATKAQADAAERGLVRIEVARVRETQAAALRARALAAMNLLLAGRQAALDQARQAQQAALAASRARGQTLRGQIARIQAQQAAAQRAAAAATSSPSPTPTLSSPALGPSGGWAIPYAIVLCESGGQNLPPNSAGASGYYQIVPGTWKLFGGSGPAAYLASKSEQDAVAARIWNGGAGASNWVCAGIVGIH